MQKTKIRELFKRLSVLFALVAAIIGFFISGLNPYEEYSLLKELIQRGIGMIVLGGAAYCLTRVTGWALQVLGND